MLKMVRRDNWKYVYTLVDGHQADAELYNLDDDPDELHNLAASQPKRTGELREDLLRWIIVTEANRGRPVPDNARWNRTPYPVPRIDRLCF